MNHVDIRNAIAEYAQGYKRLQVIQDLPEAADWIPVGDQKTGCVGEYYAMLLVRQRYPGVEARFGNPSEKGWDIKIGADLSENCEADIDIPRYIQVKTVSAYSKTRVLSPIHEGWDELWVIYLDRDLKPVGFWKQNKDSISGPWPIKGLRCPKPGDAKTGSSIFVGKTNEVHELLDAVGNTS